MTSPSRRKATDPRAVPFYIALSDATEDTPSKVLPQAYRSLLLVLAVFCNPDGGECFPALARVAKRFGLTKRRVSYMIVDLEAARWMARESRYDLVTGRQTSTRYTLYLRGGAVKVLPRDRPGRVTSFKKPLTKAEREAAGVVDLDAKRAQRATTPKT